MKKVLIVEDSTVQGKVIGRIVSKLGYAVETAKTGKEGLLKAWQSNPDLVLSDIQMPGMDGYEFCTLLKQEPDLDDIPIVMLTSYADILKGYCTGADYCLVKPPDINKLRRVLRFFLEDHLEAEHERLGKILFPRAQGLPDKKVVSREDKKWEGF